MSMTIHEAVEVLKDGNLYDKRFNPALEIAIEALEDKEREPCVDAESCEEMTTEEKEERQLEALTRLLPRMANLNALISGANFAESQKTCTDAVSREEVIDLCGSKDPNYKVADLIEDVECLPSVQPERAIGHWVAIDDEPHEDFECDQCGYISTATFGPGGITGNKHSFCPNCGAEMQGEESEG